MNLKIADTPANLEKAEFAKTHNLPEEHGPVEKFATPGVETIQALAEFENVDATKTAKAVFYSINDRVHVVVIRGDYDVNETKLRNLMGGIEPALATERQVADAGLVPGSASAIGVDPEFVIADDSAIESPNLLAGANEKGFHLRNVNFGRDWGAQHVGDIAAAREGQQCRRCYAGTLRESRGIEVGHIFKLQTVYSEPMKINFNDADGKLQSVYMGCYGIGIGRLLAAAVEGESRRSRDDAA